MHMYTLHSFGTSVNRTNSITSFAFIPSYSAFVASLYRWIIVGSILLLFLIILSLSSNSHISKKHNIVYVPSDVIVKNDSVSVSSGSLIPLDYFSSPLFYFIILDHGHWALLNNFLYSNSVTIQLQYSHG